MNLLLDSHALLWALHWPDRLRPEAADALRDPERLVFFSAASVWELELKQAVGKLELPAEWLDAAAASGFTELPVTAVAARESARLPWHHRDPFDRMLIAQAQRQSLRFVTRDPLIRAYDVDVMQA